MHTGTLQMESIKNIARLHMAFDLSNSSWKIAFGVSGRPERIVTVASGELKRLHEEISKAKRKFDLAADAPVVSCYEAGRDGFWLHRHLLSVGIENLVIDPSSIETSRRKKQIKTDRLDARKLLRKLIRHFRDGDENWSIVRPPSPEEEDDRSLHRERETLLKERISHTNRMMSLLVMLGIKVEKIDRNFEKQLESLRGFGGDKVGEKLKQRLLREYQSWCVVDNQLKELQSYQHRTLRECARADDENASENKGMMTQKQLDKAVLLMGLCGVGERSAWPLAFEFFWRKFNNRREVASAAGLTGTPFDSGESVREQGISKAGNKRIRRLLIELA